MNQQTFKRAHMYIALLTLRLIEKTSYTMFMAVVLLLSFTTSCWHGPMVITMTRQMWHMGQGHLGWVFGFHSISVRPDVISVCVRECKK